ncbi:MAG TPA: hypothetical protein DCZ91_18160 [Lachnospiraceae bacterium]|nr:hypothetical protein [Lachnospiraceae bacterium]
MPENMLQLWEQTRAFIHTVALHYQGYADLEDLEQEGYLALYDAVDGFRQEGGRTFISYASFWMRKRMKRYIDNCCCPVRIPGHERKRISEYRKMENAFLVYRGRKPTEWEITYNLDLDEQQRRDLESAMMLSQAGSLDSPISDEEGSATVGDMVPCDADIEASVLEEIGERQLSAALQEAVKALPETLAELIRMRYREGRTVRETGEALGMTVSRVRSMEFKALQELRWGNSMKAFLPEELEAQAYRHNGVQEFNRTWESSTERVAMKLLEKRY